MGIHWLQEDEPAPSLWAVVWKYVREVLEMGNAFISDRTGQRALWAWFRKSLSERCHRDRAGRMESGCVRVPILPATMEGLLRLLESSHVMLCASTVPHWLIGRIITYEASFRWSLSWWISSTLCLLLFFFNSHWQCEKGRHLARGTDVKYFWSSELCHIRCFSIQDDVASRGNLNSALLPHLLSYAINTNDNTMCTLGLKKYLISTFY